MTRGNKTRRILILRRQRKFQPLLGQKKEKRTMLNKKALLLAALILGVASEALANGLDVFPDSIHSVPKWSGHSRQAAEMLASNRGALGSARINPNSMIWHERAPVRRPSTNGSACPWLEGYPDCHADANDFQSKE
jgi:hypothetical protein